MSTKQKYLEIPSTFFEQSEIKNIRSVDGGNAFVLFWIELFLNSENGHGSWRKFEYEYADLDDELTGMFFWISPESVKKAFVEFERWNIAVRYKRKIEVRMFWKERKERTTSAADKKWRDLVIKRDENKCKLCGSEHELQVHHIIPWRYIRDDEDMLQDIENGITLCRSCHFRVHGGNWKSIDKKEFEELNKHIGV